MKHRFNGIEIDIPERYSAGHQLTEEEATALNRYFGELVMNRLRSRTKGSTDPNEINAALAEIVETFSWSTTRTVDPVIREARAIAADLLKSAKGKELADELKSAGFEPTNKVSALNGIKEIRPDLYDSIVDLARTRVEAVESLA